MNQELHRGQKSPKKLLFLIAKATWGDASWETHGFPNPSFAGKQVFSRPLSSRLPNSLSV